MLFSKTEYKEIFLPFKYEREEPKISELQGGKYSYAKDEIYRGSIGIEAYGNIFGENKYCYSLYSADEKIIDEIVNSLKNNSDKTIKVILKIKKGKLKDFKIDLGSLAEVCNNEKFKSLELIGWGLNDKSFEDSK
ncbi:hypothetical protein DW115_03025 [Clostridium sp. AM09-51]|uniref:hypothetical protein n=1 Tax=Pseudoruminococcus massiliensis TaxID=2086583 RepID=UPI000E46A05E|nr:hypothetical protein [Pseudoruminococcus massiliensis]RHO50041.1 hypothetical protein DW115_03025 [Clostridium sp. AM09-51]